MKMISKRGMAARALGLTLGLVALLAVTTWRTGSSRSLITPSLAAEPRAEAGATDDIISGPLWSETGYGGGATALTDLSDAMAAVIERVHPAVVAIATRGRLRSEDLPEDHPEVSNRRTSGEGSGFFIHASGLVVTNAHVVDKVVEVEVVLSNGTRREASVLGADGRSDIALVQVKGGAPYSTLPLGVSDDLRLGEIVLSCGNTLGLGTSIGLGILSGRKRNPFNADAGWVGGYLQTDAKIKPGNSGGPLLNARGEVVGIASAVTGPLLDIGLAIPIDAAKVVLPFLYDRGYFPQGYLGVRLQVDSVPRHLAHHFEGGQGSSVRGLQITDVVEETGAWRANLRRDDYIVSAESLPVRSVVDLQTAIGRLTVGDTVRLSVLRGSRLLKKAVVIGEKPRDFEQE